MKFDHMDKTRTKYTGNSILGITGMPGSGKGEVSRIAGEMGIQVRSLGDIVRSFYSKEYPEGSPSEIGKFADEERERFGKDIWANRLVDEVDNLLEKGSALVLIDGIRSRFEVEVFRNRWGKDFMILCIHSSPERRFLRLIERRREDDPVERESFDRRDIRELGWGLGDVIALSDMVLVNEGSMEDLDQCVRKLLRDVMH
jgi:dephospho-CoA kinase